MSSEDGKSKGRRLPVICTEPGLIQMTAKVDHAGAAGEQLADAAGEVGQAWPSESGLMKRSVKSISARDGVTRSIRTSGGTAVLATGSDVAAVSPRA
jgi:hypothetical protein